MSKKIKALLRTIKLGTIERAVQFDRAAIDEENRTVELSFSSEEPYERYWGREILGHNPDEVDLDRINNGGAFLMDHNTRDQVGVVEKAWIDTATRKARALVRFGKSARASEILQDVIDGIRRNVSVSYDIIKMALVKSEKIDGTNSAIETYRVNRWTPLEISLVSVPADATVGVGRSETGSNAREIIIENTQQEERKNMKKCEICGADYEGSFCPVCARAKEAAERSVEKKTADEKTRATEIMAMGKKHKLIEDAVRFITEGKSIDEFKTFVIDKISTPERSDLDHGSGTNLAATKPYRSLGEQLVDVIAANKPEGSTAREKLITMQRAISGMSTSVPSDGGYLIQSQFTTALLDKPEEVSQVWARCQRFPIGLGFDSLEAPFIDETSRATGSRWGGVQVYREGEALYPNGKKPKIGQYEIRLFDIKGICYATNRLLQNAVTLEAWIGKAFRSEMFFKLDDEVVRGTGAGQCVGIVGGPSTVAVAAEAGQAAGTVITENILKMYNALFAASRGSAAWFYQQDLEPQLETLSYAIGTGGVMMPLFVPAGVGNNSEKFAKLKGLPAFPIEQASASGTVGDIILADLPNGYITIDQGGIDAQSSVHVKFLEDETAFRFTYRANGAPRLRSTVAAYKGSTARSHLITLATR